MEMRGTDDLRKVVRVLFGEMQRLDIDSPRACMHATEDGWQWQEQGLAVGRGPAGAFDDRAVFTPEVFAHDGRYCLAYQVVKAPYVVRVKKESDCLGRRRLTPRTLAQAR